MTGEELKAARHKLGLSIDAFGRLVGADGRTVRRWEDSETIPGSVAVLTWLLLDHPEVRGWIEGER